MSAVVQVFGRRLPKRVDGLGVPASENLHRSGRTIASHYLTTADTFSNFKVIAARLANSVTVSAGLLVTSKCADQTKPLSCPS
jgi:hypothetical protein